jgi:hypothetical protein
MQVVISPQSLLETGIRVEKVDDLRLVNVVATGRKPLLGVGMMSGNELYIHFIEGGTVSIE